MPTDNQENSKIISETEIIEKISPETYELLRKVKTSDGREYQDRIRICEGCGNRYVWNAEDQIYYFDKNLIPPKRCPRCIAKRKSRLGAEI